MSLCRLESSITPTSVRPLSLFMRICSFVAVTAVSGYEQWLITMLDWKKSNQLAGWIDTHFGLLRELSITGISISITKISLTDQLFSCHSLWDENLSWCCDFPYHAPVHDNYTITYHECHNQCLVGKWTNPGTTKNEEHNEVNLRD